MKSKYLHLYSLLIGLLSCQVAYALDPQSVDLEAASLTPKLTVTQVYDTNIYLSNENLEEEQNSNITIINPSLHFKAQDRSREYTSSLSFTSGTYSETRAGDDDYLDYRLSVAGKFPVLTRQTLFLDAGRDSLHDNRGTAFTAGAAAQVEEPDEYKQDNVGIKYHLGDGKSKMALELGLKHSDKRYTNNKLTTGTRNFQALSIDGKYIYRTQSKLESFVQLSRKDIDYRIDNPVPGLNVQTFDGTQNSGYLGLQWKTTAKTTGSVKVGSTNKEFDDPSVEDIDGTKAWGLSIYYQATQRAKLNINSTSTLYENEGTGNARESQLYSAGWSQAWPRQLTSNLVYSLTQDVHSGSEREDDTSTLNFNLAYNFRRWMDIRIGHTSVTRESSLTAFEYEKNVYRISFIGSL